MKYFFLILFMYFHVIKTSYININILGTGLFLPYSIGVIGYMKKHLPLKNYNLTGVSGGAWCSLLYTLENDLSDHDKIWNYTVGDPNIKIKLHNNLNIAQNNIVENLKNRYQHISSEEIKHLPLSIVSTHYDNKKCKIYNMKVSEFKTINDLIDFCFCSSYIPYLSGSLMCKEYYNKYYMDGDIMRDKKFTEMKDRPDTITIHRNMWGRKFPLNNFVYTDIETSRLLFKYGWEDTEKNKDKLEKYINPIIVKRAD